MQKRSRIFRIAFGALVLSWAVGRAGATALLVPAYFDPNGNPSDWAQLTAAAKQVSVTAIFNPNSGPGSSVDPAYTAVLTSFRAAGGTAIAYVHTLKTNGTLRSLSAVEADIDKYRSFYSFDGVFVDEMTNDSNTSHVAFYHDIYAYIKSLKSSYLVVGNPGTNVPQAYASAADVLVTYEDVGSNYAANTPDAWTQSAPAAAFANMPYSVSAALLKSTLANAAARNTGYVYVTDDGADGNPYDSLPSYWTSEVQAVVPEPGAVSLGVAALFASAVKKRFRAKECS